MALYLPAFIDVSKDSEKRLAILIVFEDVLLVAPAGDMINRTGVFDA
jgi:hypothetical protein